jgi:hypothetical protein
MATSTTNFVVASSITNFVVASSTTKCAVATLTTLVLWQHPNVVVGLLF